MRRYISDNRPSFVSILETGTARGFSAICMAKALDDAGVNGHVITIDRLPHLNPIFWNCIDDLDGKKTRRELLEPWRSLCDRITFLQGDTLNQIRKVGLNRVNFAYLDAQHSREDVLNEFAFVKRLQFKGDIVFFDDVTREQFPGVCDAVDELEQREDYFVHRIRAGRGFAWAIRK
ncbi:Predicted O-methyltransferase YrrM [Qipengyuania nanhaisediminis]|uniref:Predicted O-methyltransferase YrrM n=1 Tax=Qipengyuania nanhaisediminis TaxID=604088 RepID=A0A1I5M639_9SPHN|nr:Predicted O-methyltransferase YrrM [Qipengyuania nanhaisediminis]